MAGLPSTPTSMFPMVLLLTKPTQGSKMLFCRRNKDVWQLVIKNDKMKDPG